MAKNHLPKGEDKDEDHHVVILLLSTYLRDSFVHRLFWCC